MNSEIDRLAALIIGSVESVSPTEIRVILEIDAPLSTALNTGIPTPFPRINSYIVIPSEAGAVVGLVTWLGVERSAFPRRTGLKDYGVIDLPFPLRKLALTPVGTLVAKRTNDGTAYRLERGVSVFPSVGDPALLPTPQQAEAIVTADGSDRRVRIGRSPLAADAPISVDPDKVFGRHLAVLGNTGSGKSCTVAGLIRWSLDSAAADHLAAGATPNARFIILDPNGEYSDAFKDLGERVRVFKVPPVEDGIGPLVVPAWMWNSAEWSAFASAAPATQRPLLLQALRDMKAGQVLAEPGNIRLRRNMNSYRLGLEGRIAGGTFAGFPHSRDTGITLTNLSQDAIAYRGEINESAVLAALTLVAETSSRIAETRHWRGNNNTEGYNDFAEAAIREVLNSVNDLLSLVPLPDAVLGPSEDAPIRFRVSELPDHLDSIASQNAGGGAQLAQFISTLTMRIRMMLSDHRLGPLVSSEEVNLEDWLEKFVGGENAANGNIAIVDLSLVPTDVIHIVISVIARLIFETTQRYMNYYGHELPTVLVLEEAHTFVHRGGSSESGNPTPQEMCRLTFERIAREGRKFGLGLVLSSQRPSELSQTVLAQCNTFILHRLVNDSDQELVHRLVPDTLGGLLSELPSLPARQAILLGWASPVPLLVEIDELPEEHRPRSADPHFWDVWTGRVERKIDWTGIGDRWRS